MDTDIALARLASGRAVPIGAECGCGVHGGPPGFVWKQAKRSMLGPPFSLQVSFTTVKCRATEAGEPSKTSKKARECQCQMVKRKSPYPYCRPSHVPSCGSNKRFTLRGSVKWMRAA